MNASEAREHLEIIEKIVAASSQKLEAGGEFFIAWGLVSGTLSLIMQLVLSGRLPGSALWMAAALVAAGVAYTIVRQRHYRVCGERMSLLQREFLNVLWIALALAAVVNVIGQNLFPAWGQSAIWSVMSSVVLFYIGLHGNRRALAGGIVLVVSIAAANFAPQYTGFILAAGMYVGYAGFGIAELTARE